MSTFKILKKIFPFHYSVIGEGNDKAIKEFKKYLNFKVHEIKQGSTFNGWVVPQSYKIKKAKIFDLKKNCVFDGKKNPLGLILNTSGYKGIVSNKVLKKNIFTHSENDQFTPFHCVNQYRPGLKKWGFCMSKKEKDKLNEKYYKVEIEKIKKNTSMKVLEYNLKGHSNKTVIIYSHNCHPFQANDNMSGCAVGISLIKDLMKKKNFFSYKLIIAPELLGPLFWLKSQKETSNFIGAIKLGALGSSDPMKLQKSFQNNSFLDFYAEKFYTQKINFKIGKFKEIWGNDEIVFESVGYEIPSITFTRYPFKYYHSDKDNLKNINKVKLEKSFNFLKQFLTFIEKNSSNLGLFKKKKEKKNRVKKNNKKNLKFKFLGKGLYCLSNRKYNLYKAVWEPTSEVKRNRNIGRNWHKLMTELPMIAKEGVEISYLLKKNKLPKKHLLKYLSEWEKKKLGIIYK
tara:strand:- start:81 stop:1445 length:1365 start_codon:yes stop_codon:yes gene_type:complete